MKCVIINGACGVGKSTVAKELHERWPLSFLIDVDDVGRHISHYRDFRKERWELSQAVTRASMKACFTLGKDVIVEKMIYASDVLDSYYDVAATYDVHVYEFILHATKEEVMRRAEERGWRDQGLLTPEKCERFWHQIDELIPGRPQATVVDVTKKTVEDVVREIQQVVTKSMNLG